MAKTGEVFASEEEFRRTVGLLTATLERVNQLELKAATQDLLISNMERHIKELLQDRDIAKSLFEVAGERFEDLEKTVHPLKHWEGGPL